MFLISAIQFCFDDGLEFASGEAPGPVENRTIDIPRAHLAKHLPLIDSSAPAHADRCKYTVCGVLSRLAEWEIPVF